MQNDCAILICWIHKFMRSQVYHDNIHLKRRPEDRNTSLSTETGSWTMFQSIEAELFLGWHTPSWDKAKPGGARRSVQAGVMPYTENQTSTTSQNKGELFLVLDAGLLSATITSSFYWLQKDSRLTFSTRPKSSLYRHVPVRENRSTVFAVIKFAFWWMEYHGLAVAVIGPNVLGGCCWSCLWWSSPEFPRRYRVLHRP